MPLLLALIVTLGIVAFLQARNSPNGPSLQKVRTSSVTRHVPQDDRDW